MQQLVIDPLCQLGELQLDDAEALEPVEQRHPHLAPAAGFLELEASEAPAGKGRLDVQRLSVAGAGRGNWDQDVLLLVDEVDGHAVRAERLSTVDEQRR